MLVVCCWLLDCGGMCDGVWMCSCLTVDCVGVLVMCSMVVGYVSNVRW